MEIQLNLGTLLITGGAIALLNFLSVFSALATLRWVDSRKKRAIANIFMEQVGEKLQTEADFQNIINNMKIQNDEEDKND